MYDRAILAVSDIKVKGLADLQKFLYQLPAKLEQNILRGALRAGAKLVLEAAKQNAASIVGDPSETNKKRYNLYAGALRDSIRISTRIDKRKKQVVASVKAGGKSKKTGADVFYAHIIEFTGARPHSVKKGASLRSGKYQYKESMHPGMRARPFMRPALDLQARNAVIAAAEHMKKRLASKHGLNTADLNFEADK